MKKKIGIVVLIIALVLMVAALVSKEINSSLFVDTSIFYSAGNDGNWSYVNQRKVLPDNEACYVRIASTAMTTSY